MEVASPLPFTPGQAGTKRPFAYSPALMDTAPSMDMEDVTMQQPSIKRRRFGAPDSSPQTMHNAAGTTATTPASVLFSGGLPSRSPFASITANQQNGTPQQQQHHQQQNVNAYGSNKRSRFYGPGDSSADIASPLAAASSPPAVTPEVRKLVQEQAQEIESLRSDKDTLQQSVGKLKEENDRVVNENRILKRAVTIQQERQNQAASELEAARQYKVVAEDRVKKMEQLILALRYHLQAQTNNTATNDFMGMPPRPPDVF